MYYAPCVFYIPENNEFVKWLEAKGGVFFSVDVANEKFTNIEEFLNRHHVEYPVALDSNGIEATFWRSDTFSKCG